MISTFLYDTIKIKNFIKKEGKELTIFNIIIITEMSANATQTSSGICAYIPTFSQEIARYDKLICKNKNKNAWE